MTKITCYVLKTVDNNVEVYLDEELAIQKFLNATLAWYDNKPDSDERADIVYWLEKYNTDKYVYADVSDGIDYFLILKQSVLYY